jgi:serine/threonine-protein kinase HipA
MDTAYVTIWGELVGAVAWNKATGVATFEYDSAFKKLNWDLAPLQMPIRSEKTIFEFPALRKKPDASLDAFKGLPGLLADMLPDRYGNDLINTWLAQQGRPQDSMNPVEMLCFIGTRGMGALEFEPVTFQGSKKTSLVEIDNLVDVAQKILSKKEAFSTHLQQEDERAMMEILRIGTSAGGTRPKAIIAYNEITGEVRSGQTIAPKGFQHWLLKLDGISDVQLGKTQGYGRVEMAYYNMATACGIEMMPSRLLEENGRAHFMTRRFDREGGAMKHHIQTFCALRHFDYHAITSFSYEQLFQTMRELRLSYPIAEQLFRRMVFNVLAQNCDDHTKNFSFMLKKEGSWELTPAYDICHAYRSDNKWVSQHALSINGKRKDITKEDLLIVGASIRNKKAEAVIEEINDTVGRWGEFADEVNVSPELRDEIGKTLIHLK